MAKLRWSVCYGGSRHKLFYGPHQMAYVVKSNDQWWFGLMDEMPEDSTDDLEDVKRLAESRVFAFAHDLIKQLKESRCGSS